MTRRVWVFARYELAMMRRDANLLVVIVVIPIVAVGFLQPLFKPFASARVARGASGAELAVPGVAVLFSFVVVGFAAIAVYHEHGWNTWERLRASQATGLEVICGKGLPYLLLLMTQMVLLFLVSTVLFGFRVHGSVLAVGLVMVTFALCLSCLSMAFVAISRSAEQVNLFLNLGAFVFAGIGGALTPISALPAWVRAVAPALPSYWAVRGFRSVILERGDVQSVLLPIVVLAGFAFGFALLASWRFRFEERKVY